MKISRIWIAAERHDPWWCYKDAEGRYFSSRMRAQVVYERLVQGRDGSVWHPYQPTAEEIEAMRLARFEARLMGLTYGPENEVELT